MSQVALFDSLVELFTAIDSCVERRLQLPTLILIYAGMDSIGWLSVENPNGPVGQRFTTWVETFLLPAKRLPCTAADLYSARCGVLHTLTADSDLISKGRAKHLGYAWGTAKAGDLQRELDRTHPGVCVAVHINDLTEGLRLATARMFDQADKDPVLAQRLQERAKRHFIGLNADFTRVRTPLRQGAPTT